MHPIVTMFNDYLLQETTVKHLFKAIAVIISIARTATHKLFLLPTILLAATLIATPAQAITITGMDLYGGSGGATWVSNGQIWSVSNPAMYVLGVSATPNGTLVNQATSISVPFNQNYWLYAEPTTLGSTALINVFTDVGTFQAIFNITGISGTESVWSLVSGNSQLQLGWAAGTANKVGAGRGLVPSGANDYYLHLTAGTTSVPLPSTLLLLAAGMAILAGTRLGRKNATLNKSQQYKGIQ